MEKKKGFEKKSNEVEVEVEFSEQKDEEDKVVLDEEEGPSEKTKILKKQKNQKDLILFLEKVKKTVVLVYQ